jgi:cell division protease FtsH
MPQDKGRWRVAPAPDGRGMPEEHKPPAPHRLRGFWILVLVVLAINWLALLMAQPSGEPRVKVPFSPYFLQQVQAGKVRSISSKGDTINGTFATKTVYPPDSRTATPTTLFSAEVPTFWNNASLTALLQAKGVQVNAQNPNPGTSPLGELLLGFGPTLLLIGLFWFWRAGRGPDPVGWVGWAISGVQRRGGWTRRRSG